MVDITIFELHLDEPNLTANAPFSGSSGKDVGASDEPLESESSSSKGKLVGALVGLVFLAAVAFVAKRKVGGGGSEEEEQLELADATA